MMELHLVALLGLLCLSVFCFVLNYVFAYCASTGETTGPYRSEVIGKNVFFHLTCMVKWIWRMFELEAVT